MATRSGDRTADQVRIGNSENDIEKLEIRLTRVERFIYTAIGIGIGIGFICGLLAPKIGHLVLGP